MDTAVRFTAGKNLALKAPRQHADATVRFYCDVLGLPLLGRAQPSAGVWAVLTEAEHLGRWFADAGATVDLQPGGDLVLHWADHGTVRGRIEAVEPCRRLAFRWAPFKDPGGSEPAPGNATLVEFTLRTEGRANHDDNTEGWALELSELRAHVVGALR